jgi:GGDEF domain-containing protein
MRAIETLQYIQSNSKATLEKGITVPLLFSLGFAIAEEDSEYQDLFKTADEEMYKNKAERKKKQRENKE